MRLDYVPARAVTSGARLLLALALLVGALLVPVGPLAAQENGIELEAAAGFDGFYKAGSWVPVTVIASNSGADISGELRIVTGSPNTGDAVTYSAPLDLPSQSNKRVVLLVNIPRFSTNLDVVFVDDNGRIAAQITSNRLDTLTRDDLLYGIISPAPDELTFLQNLDAGRSRAEVAFLNLNDLPETAVAWTALDVLVLDDIDVSQLTPAQLAALSGWIDTGGQLVVTGGPNWQQTAVPLSDLLPVTLSGTVTVDDLPALRDATGDDFRDAGPYLLAGSSLRPGSEALLTDADVPLLARRPQGRGAVYFLALDPKLAPLLDWDGNPALWAPVADDLPPLPAWGRGVQNSFAAQSAVEALPAISLPSVLQLLGFLLAYIVIIGPINYLVLKRLNRRELAWFTIPVLVVVFSGLTYLIGFQIKGNVPILNQMAVAFGHLDSEQMRVENVLGLYSPRRAVYALMLPADSAARPLSESIRASTDLDAVVRDSAVTLEGIRTDVSEVATFVADSYQPVPDIRGEARVEELNGRSRLIIALQNNSSLALQDVSIMLEDQVYALGDLPPGGTLSQTQLLSVPTAAPGVSPPLFGPTVGIAPPLMENADTILSTSDFYNDPQAYPRWQLLQALENSLSPDGTQVLAGEDVVTLIAWANVAQPTPELQGDEVERQQTTVYFLELPLAP